MKRRTQGKRTAHFVKTLNPQGGAYWYYPAIQTGFKLERIPNAGVCFSESEAIDVAKTYL